MPSPVHSMPDVAESSFSNLSTIVPRAAAPINSGRDSDRYGVLELGVSARHSDFRQAAAGHFFCLVKTLKMHPAIVVSSINGFLLLCYVLLERAGTERLALAVAVVLVTACFLYFLSAERTLPRVKEALSSCALVISSCLAMVIIFESTFFVYPTLFPDNLRTLVGATSVGARQKLVELLPYNPYAKPRPNVRLHTPGYYGPKEFFEYEWNTDRRGYKNLPTVASLEKVDAIALGDSFTEGFGVQTSDTWSSQLSALGLSTYSMGVQGYAPTQYLGTFERFGRNLSPKWVFIGYLGSVYQRESLFQASEAEIATTQKLPSAIGRLVDQERLDDPIFVTTKNGSRVPLVVRKRHRFATTALIDLAWRTSQFAWHFDEKEGIKDLEADPRFASDLPKTKSEYIHFPPMVKYQGELRLLESTQSDGRQLAEDVLWKSTLRVFTSVARDAHLDGAKVLLVFFPNRASAYYQKATGRTLPSSASDLVEARLLGKFAKENGIEFLDLTSAFQDAADKLAETSDTAEYPFLKSDGHPSARGHSIIANEIYRKISALSP